MNGAAFFFLTLMLAGYVLLDGYDLGVGAVHLFLARTDAERADSLAAIGPFWNGNEVVLIAAAAMLFALFPTAYAAAFSGFYLPLIVVLWLLMGRGMSIELREQFPSELWRGFWDVTFALCSALLAFVLGLSFGNVLRGVPFDARGNFAGTFGFLLNGYAIGVGALALAALALHGAAFLAWRTSGNLQSRARSATRFLWPAVVLLFAFVTWATLRVHPMHAGILFWLAPVAGVAGLLGILVPRTAFRFGSSALFLFCLVVSAGTTLFPFLLPAYPAGTGGLTIDNAGALPYASRVGMLLFGIGVAATVAYATFAARRLLLAERPSGAGGERPIAEEE